MQNSGLDEAQAGIKIAERNINNLRYTDDTTFMAESEEELNRFLLKVKKESEKAGLKLSIQKRVRKIPWRREWQPIPVFLPGESHERRIQVGYSPRGRKESDTTERLHFSLSSVILVYNFLFMWYLYLILLSGWGWTCRTNLGVFFPLQSFGRIWEGQVLVLLFMFGRTHLWSHLQRLLFAGRYLITVSISILVIDLFIFSNFSWFGFGRFYLLNNFYISYRFSILLAFTWSSLIAQLVKNLPVMQETPVQFLSRKDLLEKGEATHSSILGLPLGLSW